MTDEKLEPRSFTEPHHFTRLLDVKPAAPGWRGIVPRSRGTSLWNGHEQVEITTHTDYDQFTTDQLGHLEYLIGWAIVEHWSHDLPPGWEMDEPADDSYERAKYVDPLLANLNGDTTWEYTGLIRLVPPEETLSPHQLRAELINSYHQSAKYRAEDDVRTRVAH